MNSIDRLLGRAQFVLSLIIVNGFLAALGLVLFRTSELTQTQLTIITGLLGTLGTVFALVANFWFSRHRPQTALNGEDDSNPTQPATPAGVKK